MNVLKVWHERSTVRPNGLQDLKKIIDIESNLNKNVLKIKFFYKKLEVFTL